MYYKILVKGSVVDVLDRLVYVRYDKRHNSVNYCTEDFAEGVMASDRSAFYRTQTMHENGGNFPLAEIVEISEREYNQLKMLGLMTPQEIIDAYTLSLIEGGIL